MFVHDKMSVNSTKNFCPQRQGLKNPGLPKSPTQWVLLEFFYVNGDEW